MSLDPKFYLTVTTRRTQCYYCNYCGAEQTFDLDDIGVTPFDGVNDPLAHDEDCDRLEG